MLIKKLRYSYAQSRLVCQYMGYSRPLQSYQQPQGEEQCLLLLVGGMTLQVWLMSWIAEESVVLVLQQLK